MALCPDDLVRQILTSKTFLSEILYSAHERALYSFPKMESSGLATTGLKSNTDFSCIFPRSMEAEKLFKGTTTIHRPISMITLQILPISIAPMQKILISDLCTAWESKLCQSIWDDHFMKSLPYSKSITRNYHSLSRHSTPSCEAHKHVDASRQYLADAAALKRGSQRIMRKRKTWTHSDVTKQSRSGESSTLNGLSATLRRTLSFRDQPPTQ